MAEYVNQEARGKIKESGMYFSDRCQFCGDFGEKVEPYLCPKCVIRMKELGYRKLPTFNDKLDDD